MKKRARSMPDGWKQLKLEDCFKKAKKPFSTFSISQFKSRLITPLPSLSHGSNSNSDEDEKISSQMYEIEECSLAVKLPSLPNSQDSDCQIVSDMSFHCKRTFNINFIKEEDSCEMATLRENERAPSLEQTSKEIAHETAPSLKPNIERTPSLERNIKNESGSSDDKAIDQSEIETNPIAIKCIEKMIDWIKTHPLIAMLTDEETAILNQFIAMPNNYKLFAIKLFTRKHKWYNIHKITTIMKINMAPSEIDEMYNDLAAKDFVSVAFHNESTESLLNLLLLNDIKDLCKGFKIKLAGGRKEMIDKLINHCHLPALSFVKVNTSEILLNRVKAKLGKTMKMSASLRDLLTKINLMYCFVVSDEFLTFADLYLFMHQISLNVVVLPEYRIDVNTQIFANREHFCSYLKALELKRELNVAIDKKVLENVLFLARSCFTLFKSELDDCNANLLLFEANHVLPGQKYASALTKAAETLIRPHFAEVFDWLQVLLGQTLYNRRKRGFWYKQKALIQYKYMRKHEDAAATIIEALNDPHLSDVDKCELSKKGNAIKNAKKNKVAEDFCAQISTAQCRFDFKFPTIVIDAVAMSDNTPGTKRKYKEVINGTENYFLVEEIAINHYYRVGFKNVLHCEGRLLRTCFFIIFWDIIFDPNIPNVFLNEIQSYPLDLHTTEFFTRREEAILSRLSHLATAWSNSQLKHHIGEVWLKHSNKRMCVGEEIKNALDLYYIVMCIGRSQLAKIFERLCKNVGLYAAGLPDLFMWNIENKECKFVEVKGEHDKLSTKQELWLEFLQSLNVDVEVCHVHSVGSKDNAKYKHVKRMKRND